MTTGNVTYSSFVSVPGLPSGANSVGLFQRKIWTGQDRPKVEYVKRPKVYVLRELISERTDRKGATHTTSELKRFYVGRERSQFGQASPPKRGEVDHTYSATIDRWSDEEVTYFAGDTYRKAVVNTFGHPTWAPTTLLTANDQLKLVEKLREKILGSSFDCAVFLGELHQTTRLIADTAIRVRKALLNLRRGNVVAATRWLLEGTPRYGRRDEMVNHLTRNDLKGHARTLSSKWLEIQYGWRPLLEDAGSAAEFMAQRLSVPFKQTYRVFRRVESNLDQTFTTGNSPSSGPVYTGHGRSTRTHGRQIKAILTESPGVLASLGLLNPENVAWELTPYSFVIDWFIPIGQYMEARAFSQHLKGEFWTSNHSVGIRRTPTSNDPAFRKLRASWVSVSTSRAVSSTLDVPFPEFKPLGKVASWQHCANAVALLVQLRKSWAKAPEFVATPNLVKDSTRWSGKLD